MLSTSIKGEILNPTIGFQQGDLVRGQVVKDQHGAYGKVVGPDKSGEGGVIVEYSDGTTEFRGRIFRVSDEEIEKYFELRAEEFEKERTFFARDS